MNALLLQASMLPMPSGDTLRDLLAATGWFLVALLIRRQHRARRSHRAALRLLEQARLRYPASSSTCAAALSSSAMRS